MIGYQLAAQSLAKQKIQHCYGIVGIPVIQLGFAIQGVGINYYGFRNQQQAAYSAGYTGFLTGKPGVCLCVSGPGHTNAISGILNAWVNSWPMVLISGSNDLDQTQRGAFQQVDQCYFVKPYTKYSVRVTSAKDIPYHVNKAVRLATTGRPGPVYLDFPGNVLNETVEEQIEIPIFTQPPAFCPSAIQIRKAVNVIGFALKPLIIVGKGAAYGGAEKQVRQFIQKVKIPFLPTPMGKGVMPDSHPLNVSAARSFVLKQADVIILLGAKLNWILHFGYPPRFSKNVKIIQADIHTEQMSNNVQSVARLVGDMKQTVSLLSSSIKNQINCLEWKETLKKRVAKNLAVNEHLMTVKSVPMTYYSSYGIIKKYLPKQMIMIGEGANTMDIGRTIFTHQLPRRKLDAGTFGTMGIGIAALISARSTNPGMWGVCVMGDSAFGFSGMECQTVTRYKLGGVIFIINNNGIYSGTDKLQGDPKSYGVTHLNPDTKYEKFTEAFGGQGFSANSIEELDMICKKIFSSEQNKTKLYIVNVHIQPDSSKKPQQDSWLTRNTPAPKL